MLERHEQNSLAEIEARLHAEDPELSEALDAGVALLHVHPAIRATIAMALAIGITSITTLVFGPDIGGLIAVLTLSFAAMYAWQALRVCRGLQR